MSPQVKRNTKVARLLLLIWVYNLFFPAATYALTSGPAQPETQAFQQASVSDMVDLQTGDFKYNIPLLDIDGYPVNLNYQSGVGIDDEASWVGLGWNLNTGAVNRQLRGLPDDMRGEKITTRDYRKEMITVGGRGTAKLELFGFGKEIKDNVKKILGKGTGSFSYGVFFNNYTGIGAEVSINPGISLSRSNSTSLSVGLGFGISSNTQSGASFTPYASLSVYTDEKGKQVSQAGLTASLGYNSRSGLKSLSLAETFQSTKHKDSYAFNGAGASISYNTEPIMPKISIPYKTNSYSFSVDAGLANFGTFVSGGLTGYRTTKSILSNAQQNPGYGFLYADLAKDDAHAVMDFIREKESLVIPDLPNLALPIQTHDLFSYTNQLGSGQFRLYRGGTGIFFDNQTDDSSENGSIGIDAGLGNLAHWGLTLYPQTMNTTAKKWTDDNRYANVGDFQTYDPYKPNYQNVFFKPMGEKSAQNEELATALGKTAPVQIDLSGKRAENKFLCPTCNTSISSKIESKERQPGATTISYLTASEATFAALNKTIDIYDGIDESNLPATFNASPKPNTNSIVRVDPVTLSGSDIVKYPAYLIDPTDPTDLPPDRYPSRKANHISEITVTDATGRRMVYGTPVYNVEQTERSFAIGKGYNKILQGGTNNPDRETNLTNQAIDAIPGLNKGIDNYYHSESIPPYATSYLLSGILSADYVDRTNDGITDDDLGTAIKFNYSRVNGLYNWRAPFENVVVNKGQLADPDDDKGSVIYGRKELWYISSIESKTKIAYFITKDRLDGLGVGKDWKVGGKNADVKQKCLMQIRLYSKADMSRPIKVVKFDYNYELCPYTPNSNAPNGGKLTLKSVWFEYANVTKGANHAYKFSYNQPIGITSAGVKGAYGYMLTDRWGVYKSRSENVSAALSNEEFPYTDQDRSKVSENASLWHLGQIQLPTGGVIKVTYETDDYAYVQNKKAMRMYKIDALCKDGNDLPGAGATQNGLNLANQIRVTLPDNYKMPTSMTRQNFINDCLNGSSYMYVKLNVKMNTNISGPGAEGDYDFVSCFAEVGDIVAVNGKTLLIGLKKLTRDVTNSNVETNPIAIAAWQKLKDEYPLYAYPGYDNKASGGGISAVVSATINAISNIGELTRSFYEKADGAAEPYASIINKDKSFVRLTKNEGAKIGGGVRVERIEIDDQWWYSNNPAETQNTSYGQKYIYELEDGSSSGVASYEPSIGNDENPFKMPIPYSQKKKGAITNLFQLEEPFGESVFPAPGITYSRVVTKDLVKKQGLLTTDVTMRTGYVVNEFYTTKDFPVKVNVLGIKTNHTPPNTPTFSFILTSSYDELVMSQGYSIELNDMNGKLKATRVFKEAKDATGKVAATQVSATEYFYKADKLNGEALTLNNSVQTIDIHGDVKPKVIGQEIELFTDFREQSSKNEGTTFNIGNDFFLSFPLSLILHFPININQDNTLFRSACAVKVIQSYGILEKVVKTQDGSSIATQNIAFDAVTGEAIVTKTQNEFKKDIYSVNIPAYWGYEGMGGAYKTLGMVIGGLKTDETGLITDKAEYVAAGDVIEDLTDAGKVNLYWVLEQETGNGTAKRLVDQYGRTIAKTIKIALQAVDPNRVIQPSELRYEIKKGKVIRSGYRNMLDGSISTYTCLNNPIEAGRLRLADNTDLSTLKVLNASVNEFNEDWVSEVPDIKVWEPPTTDINYWGYSPNPHPYPLQTPYRAGFTYPAYFEGKMQMGSIWLSYVLENPDNDPNPPSFYYWMTRATSTLIRPNFLGAGDNLYCFSKVYLPRTGTYFIGLNGSIPMTMAFDDGPYLFSEFGVWNGENGWFIIETPELTAGEHIIKIKLRPDGTAPAESGFGMEIYNNTSRQQLIDKQDNVIWSTTSMTSNLHGQEGLFMAAYAEKYLPPYGNPPVVASKYYWTDGPGNYYSPLNPADKALNPFMYGIKGNWRLSKTKVFEEKRKYRPLTDKVVDVKNAGYITNFYPNWYAPAQGSPKKRWLLNNNSKWVTANTVTQYDKYGQQLENKDALDRYSAAKFSFNGELPSAVASNAMQREIYAESFEDAKFSVGIPKHIDPNKQPFFTSSAGGAIKYLVTNQVSHSGNNSIQLYNDGIFLYTKTFNERPAVYPLLTLNTQTNEYNKTEGTGKYPNGFEPLKKEYIFNAWVKDIQPTNKAFKGLILTANGQDIPLTVKAIVEGWKLMEGRINIESYVTSTALYTGAGVPIELKLKSPESVSSFVDDIRIFPKDASMKTYAYDEKTLRLMAELDENCFATFYEYDSQGALVRVKKETERGIMTLKENRSSYKKGL
ncbi:hypothetical protein [Mucilaginibacter auburnensis]|uniref:PA14 domain-containing protein n=1 Tax=Mucilaginibacter auburnensis TaxID=1457233 RepID=A0A2H9VNR4_9SPHI|nr:hypothetical protein [Mucilaginibacter auburnensis]PJJ79985.1 hypothetical protein CLV57_3127 [Mucilaginibacter auburnensis]